MLDRLRRARLATALRGPTVDAILQRELGLHSTDYWTPYLGLWARVGDGFDPAPVFQALQTGRLVRLNAFRTTIHVVRPEDAPLILRAVGERTFKQGRRSPALRALSDRAIEAGLDALYAALADGPATREALAAALPDQAKVLRYWLLCAMGVGAVVRADAKHARSNRTRYALAAQWVPGFAPSALTPAEARRALIHRYIRGYGPVCAADVAWWLPATKTEVKRAVADLPHDLFALEVGGDTWYAPKALADVDPQPQGAWLLPYEDGLAKGCIERDWYLAAGLRPVVFPWDARHYQPPDGPGPAPDAVKKAGNVQGEIRPSIWWGGQVVGRFELARDGAVRWRLDAPVPAEGRQAVQTRVAALQGFVADRLAPLSR